MPTGTRHRFNGIFGTVTDNPLTAGAGTFNSAGLTEMGVVSAPDHAIVTLDPLKQYGAPEIIVVTVHTASASVASITRGAYGTTARSHPQGTLWVHAPLDEDFIEIVTAATRPSNPYEGQEIYETDTDSYRGYNGAAWEHVSTLGAWTAYTPTWLQGATTITKTVNRAVWIRSGRSITVALQMTATGAGSANNFLLVGLPVTAAFASNIAVGSGYFIDASAVNPFFSVTALLHDTSTIKFLGTNVVEPTYFGGTGAAFAAAIASGDLLTVTIMYEAAS